MQVMQIAQRHAARLAMGDGATNGYANVARVSRAVTLAANRPAKRPSRLQVAWANGIVAMGDGPNGDFYVSSEQLTRARAILAKVATATVPANKPRTTRTGERRFLPSLFGRSAGKAMGLVFVLASDVLARQVTVTQVLRVMAMHGYTGDVPDQCFASDWRNWVANPSHGNGRGRTRTGGIAQNNPGTCSDGERAAIVASLRSVL